VVVVDVVVVEVIVVVTIVVVVWHKDGSETTVPSEQTYSLWLTQPEIRMIIANNANKIIIFIFQICFSFLNNLMNE